MKLVLDFGNTLKKFALFEGNKLVKLEKLSSGEEDLEAFTRYFLRTFSISKPHSVILSSVVNYPESFDHYLSSNFSLLKFNQLTPLPYTMGYKSPETLGRDRMAVAAVASTLFRGKMCWQWLPVPALLTILSIAIRFIMGEPFHPACR